MLPRKVLAWLEDVFNALWIEETLLWMELAFAFNPLSSC